MVKQGDVIKTNLDPIKGHEQAGYRPVLVVSNENFNSKTNMRLVCPISNTVNSFQLHVKLEHTATTGEIRCEQVRAIDLKARPFTYIETISQEILQEVTDIIYGSIEIV